MKILAVHCVSYLESALSLTFKLTANANLVNNFNNEKGFKHEFKMLAFILIFQMQINCKFICLLAY